MTDDLNFAIKALSSEPSLETKTGSSYKILFAPSTQKEDCLSVIRNERGF